MLNLRFLLRELVQSRKQATVFVLCVALSIFSMVALNSFRDTVQNLVLGDARSLQGGDLLLHSHYPFGPALMQAVAGLEQSGQVRGTRIYECYSVIRPMAGVRSLLSRLKIVGPGYPLYGRVELQSGLPLETVLTAGRVVAEREVLDRLGLQVGDQVYIGSAVLTIADIILREPDRPVEVFALGPRILISEADLDRLQLIGKGSRVDYGILLKIRDRDADIKAITAGLLRSAQPEQEQVSTALNARSGVKVFFDNLFFFLSLISIFTLLLAGIGMQTSLAALLRGKRTTLAIIKAMGASGGFLFRHYFVLTLGLGLIGSLTGMALGAAVQRLLPVLFTGLLPAGITPALRLADAGQGLLLGLLVVIFFTFLPLQGLRHIRPAALFRQENQSGTRGMLFYPTVAAGLLLLALLIIRQLQDLRIGLYFIAGALALIACIWLLTRALLAASAKIRSPFLGLRQAHKSLFRPGNATGSIIVTLACALSVLLAIYLVRTNLEATYVESYPPEAPNLFFLDIQPDQRQAFIRKTGQAPQLFPVVRARLVSINGQPVRERQQPQQRGDSLTREFSLTYRNNLLADEVVSEGGSLFRRDRSGAVPLQVSVLDTVAEMGDMHLGDRLEFNIQGVPLQAQISSIRTRTKSRLYPFFYFVFPEEFLRDAPQTSFAALHIDPQEITGMENRIVSAFPNISFINMAQTAAELGELARRLAGIVNFFAGFSILAGTLIIIGSILATRLARVREAVYYTILGADSRFVLSVFIYEHLLLGLFSSLIAVMLAQLGSWALCRFLFNIGYLPHWSVSFLLIVLTPLLVVVIGLLSSAGILRQRPAQILREQTGE